MSPAAIEARGLEKRFGAVVALRGIDFQVPEGSLFAVLGPNGAGKSTLLHLLAGLTRPSAGRLRVGPESTDRRRLRAGIGLVGHATFLQPELTARENLLFAGRLYGVRDGAARADALLAEHHLEDWAGRPARTLSRGLAQRVAIARALVHDPPIVLLDEPFTGLDPGSASRLSRRLAALRERRRTVVLVSHDLARAAELADAALVLQRGRVALATEGEAITSDSLEKALAGGVS
ncbi:MAG: ABC transporter ATP-binding protein [Myxococcota bacterium]